MDLISVTFFFIFSLITRYFLSGMVCTLVTLVLIGLCVTRYYFDMTRKLKSGKEKCTALVTGGSSGIGLAFASCLVKDGNDVILVARNEEKLKEAKEKLEKMKGEKDLSIKTISCDLSNIEEVEKLPSKIEENVDILVCNAAMGELGEYFEDTTKEKIKNQVNVNALGTTLLVHSFLERMKKIGKGKIVIIGAIIAEVPVPSASVYIATKAYLRSFCRSLDWELKKYKSITVTDVIPGKTATNRMRGGHNLNLMEEPSSFLEQNAMEVAEKGYRDMWDGKRRSITNLKGGFLLDSILSKLLPIEALMALFEKEFSGIKKK